MEKETMTPKRRKRLVGKKELRDWFAGQALVGLIINSKTVSVTCPITKRAYELADAMLETKAIEEE